MADNPYSRIGASNSGATTGNNPYARIGASGGGTPAKKKGRGILGTILHLPEATAKDLYHIALNTPGGVKQFGEAEYSALKSTVQHPWVSREKGLEMWQHPLRPVAGTANTPQITQFGEANLKGLEETAQHPLRHPGQTLLIALPVASGLAKVGLAARAGYTGVPLAETRTLTVGDLAVHPELSRSGLGQVSQLAYDKALQVRAAANPGGRAAGRLDKKVGKVLDAQRRQAEAIAAGPAKAVINLGRKLSPGEQKALEVYGEKASLSGRITAAASRVTSARTPEARARHQVELDLLHQASDHLAETPEGVQFAAGSAGKLGPIYERMATVAGDRTTLAKGLGMLTEEAAQNRMTKAGRVALGARFIPGWEARASAKDIRDAAAPGLDAEMRAARAEVRAAKKTARELDAQATKAENEAYRTGTQRTAAEREALAATAKANRAAATASAQRATHAERAIRGERLAGLIVREQRIAQINWERFQRGDIGEGVLARSHVRLGNLLDAYERDAGSVTTMRAATRRGTAAVAEQESTLQRLRTAEQEATATHERAKAAAQAVRGNASRAAYQIDLVKRVTETGLGKRRAEVARAMQEQLNRADRIVGQEQFVAPKGAIRIPDVTTRRGRKQMTSAAVTQVGGQGVLGVPRAPGSLTHEYTGALRESGYRKQYTGYWSRQYSPTAQVAQSSLEMAKYAGLDRIRQQSIRMASPTPRNFRGGKVDDLAVRLDNLTATEALPPGVRAMLNDPAEFFANATPDESLGMFEKVRQSVFMDPRTLSTDKQAELEQLFSEGKIGWVPRAALGSLAKPSAPLSAILGKRAVGTIDAINNAQRFAILYLKPAYALPNLLGNAALSVLQQGYAAPQNLREAVWMNHILGPELTGRIDAVVQEGYVRSLSAHGTGPMSRVVDMAANFWSKGVDVPFRRASFLYEAKRAGYRTPKELNRLLTDSAEYEKLLDVSLKANREMIDYANLSNREREVIRRVIFFYPWVKGSTVYAGRMLREHPVGSAVIGALGQRGYEQYQRDFPLAPSYLEGSIKVGNRLLNPAAASILGTPAQVGRVAADVATGRISNIGNPEGLYTPAMALTQALLTRQTGSGYPYPTGTNAAQVAKDQLFTSLPQVSLYRNIRGQNPYGGTTPLYPPSPQTGIARFLVGGLYPRPVNWQRLYQQGATERARLKG